MLMRAANGRVRNRATLFILAALVVGSALGPMLWAISTSLKNEVNAVSAIPSLIPSPATFSNYFSVFSHKTFLIELVNSVLYAAGAVVIALAVGIPAGYAASRYIFAAKLPVMLLIVAPSMVRGFAAVAVIAGITTWNDYITIAVFAPDTAKRTLQVALVNQVFDAVGISWSFTMAFALIASLPVILMFLLVQKWFIAGLTAGAVKG